MPTINGQGAAASGAGEGYAGFGYPDEPSARVIATPVKAIAFDPYNRVYEQNADLTMKEVSPTMQRAALLVLPLGSLPSTPRNGVDLKDVANASNDERQRAAEDAMKVALKPLLDERVLRIERVTLEGGSEDWTGRIITDVIDLTTEKPGYLETNARTPR